MSYFQINLRDSLGWTNFDDIFVRGSAFVGNDLKQGVALAKHFENVTNPQEFVSLLKELNGFYAVILKKNNIVMAAVDRVRSFPLFYACVKDKLFLSDDAEWVRLQVGGEQRGRLAETEFLLTGYVTGEDTLYPEAKQLQAGEALTAYADGSKVIVEKNRYYRYLHNIGKQIDKDTRAAALDQVVINCIQRLIRWADGRGIVIPLSGGYDSRLIATTLKRLGYDRIVAFSYGRPGNKEAEISKWVAKCLDIPWHFVPYSNEAWWKWFHSEERVAYYRIAHNLASLPHIQDWPAVKMLKARGVIGPDAVFVPGHTGDFLTGGHIPESFFRNAQIGEKLFLDAVIKKHYSLWPFDKLDNAIKEELKDRIMQTAETKDLLSPAGAADAIEKWDWQERQAKFIINSVRVYEFWEYDWWLPLWDADMMDFWTGVPLELRKEQKLYIEYVTQIYARVAGLDNHTEIQSANRTATNRLKQIIKQTSLLPLAKAVYYPIKKRWEYNNHPLAWYGIMERKIFDAHLYDFANINSFLVRDVLGIESL